VHLAASFNRDSRRLTITYIFTLSSFIDLSSPDTLSFSPALNLYYIVKSNCYFDITGGFLVPIGIPAIMTAASVYGDDDEGVSRVMASLCPSTLTSNRMVS
jgi:hypothetical protein